MQNQNQNRDSYLCYKDLLKTSQIEELSTKTSQWKQKKMTLGKTMVS
jgi:hypothetical protein